MSTLPRVIPSYKFELKNIKDFLNYTELKS